MNYAPTGIERNIYSKREKKKQNNNNNNKSHNNKKHKDLEKYWERIRGRKKKGKKEKREYRGAENVVGFRAQNLKDSRVQEYSNSYNTADRERVKSKE